MFCPSNDTLQTLTEKTKLLAQKCTQQIRAQQQQLSQQQQYTQQQQQQTQQQHQCSPIKKDINGIKKETIIGKTSTGFKCFCACKGSLRIIGKRSPVKDGGENIGIGGGNTRWYVKQPTWRLWGEEREPDAIFTVYLKKVRYHRPTPSASSQDSDDEISHLEWETVRVRFVKAASLSRLVEALATDDGELESTFINVFLATYRTFASVDAVLDLLVQRYETLNLEPFQAESVAEQHKKTLVSALHVWLDGYPEDWKSTSLQRLLAFTSKRLANSELHVKALHRLDRVSRIIAPLSWSQEYSDVPDQFSGLCLTPAFRGPSHVLQAYRFPHIPVKHFAEQLTRMDMELFKRLIPHQCLGAVWARREKNEANTVLATVQQFNAVSFRVISSILIEPRLKPPERALVICTWIDIAQELRILKNFSSLKAIICGLQSNAVYRLSKTWQFLSREKLEMYTELARIFSEDNNAFTQREVLMREGTAKFADTAGENDKQLQKVFQKQNTHISHGTIPYLGTFLTDLTMIHAAIPDTIPENLINFDKRRKEFEILAQIKLLQGAANSYNLPEDPLFDRWFASLLVLDERESHTLSCQLEPPTEPPKKQNNHGHKKSDSIASNSSSGAGSQFYCDINTSNSSSKNNSLDRDQSPPNASIMSGASSVSSLSIDSSISSGQKLINNHKLNNIKHSNNNTNNNINNNNNNIINNGPIINGQLINNSPLKNTSPDFYIIKVTYETANIELDGIVLYKSIMLCNNERTPQVIRNAMMKLDLNGDPDLYTLSQVLPDKELVMPQNANVYYAVNTTYNLNFILRPKKDDNKLN